MRAKFLVVVVAILAFGALVGLGVSHWGKRPVGMAEEEVAPSPADTSQLKEPASGAPAAETAKSGPTEKAPEVQKPGTASVVERATKLAEGAQRAAPAAQPAEQGKGVAQPSAPVQPRQQLVQPRQPDKSQVPESPWGPADKLRPVTEERVARLVRVFPQFGKWADQQDPRAWGAESQDPEQQAKAMVALLHSDQAKQQFAQWGTTPDEFMTTLLRATYVLGYLVPAEAVKAGYERKIQELRQQVQAPGIPPSKRTELEAKLKEAEGNLNLLSGPPKGISAAEWGAVGAHFQELAALFVSGQPET